jgi:hypothetical protein
MKAYLSRVQRIVDEQTQNNHTTSENDINVIPTPPSHELAERLKAYVSSLPREQQSIPLYEVDIMSMFATDRKTLAIATHQLCWHAERVWLNGVKVLGYWPNKDQ